MNRTLLLKYINRLKKKIRDHEVFQEMLEEWDAEEDILDLIPVAFADLDVSARTDHGIIYLGYKLLDKDNNDNDMGNDHYLIHEISHYLQQCYGDKPTQSSDDGDYLENEYEQEGFQNQTAYISDEYGEDDAEEYIEQVLDHHDAKGKDREHKKDELLNIARSRNGMQS